MQKKTCFLAAAILGMAPALAAAAEGREGVYGLAGISRYKLEDKGAKDAAGKRDVWKANTNAVSLGGGVRVSPNLAFEGGYRFNPRGVKRDGVGKYSSQSLDASMLVIMPVGDRVELFGRAGAAYMRNSLKPAVKVEGIKAPRDSMLAARLGVGMDFHLSENTFIRAEASVLKPRKSGSSKVLQGKKWQSEGVALSIGQRF